MDLVSTNVMHMVTWDTLLVIKYFQHEVKRVLNLAIKQIEQLVVGVRLRTKRVVERVAE